VPQSVASISDMPNPSKSRLNAVPVPSFPKRNHEHAGREADKRSGEDVTEKMIITDDEATGHSRDHRRVNWSISGITDPKKMMISAEIEAMWPEGIAVDTVITVKGIF
jgi:hypothetical protein